jgi:Tfp pilus assembly protein PilF
LIRFHKAVRENPRLLNSWQGIAESMQMLGMHDEAARAYVRASQRYLDTYRLTQAKELAESALAMDPDNEKAAELSRRAAEKLRGTDD